MFQGRLYKPMRNRSQAEAFIIIPKTSFFNGITLGKSYSPAECTGGVLCCLELIGISHSQGASLRCISEGIFNKAAHYRTCCLLSETNFSFFPSRYKRGTKKYYPEVMTTEVMTLAFACNLQDIAKHELEVGQSFVFLCASRTLIPEFLS